MSAEPFPFAVRAVPAASARRLVLSALLLLFSYVYLANAWIGDDSQITFRTIWNFVHGYGLTFNPDERVQAYTDPLWMLLVTGVYFVTREFFFTVTVLSWVLNVATGVRLVRRLEPMRAAVLVGLVLSSKALVDYSSSGLEYPLAYLLIALFYVPYLSHGWRDEVTLRALRFYLTVAALSVVTRVDMAVLFVVPVADLMWRAVRQHGVAIARPVLLGALPAIAWMTFATFYYGFPLPNTYYAKVANGIPAWLQREQGLAYLFNSISHDPITLGTVMLSLLVCWSHGRSARIATLSAALYVLYTVSVGGDFMSGRFFAMPFLVAATALVPALSGGHLPLAGAALVLYNVLVPLAPIKTTAAYDGAWPWRTQNGIKDERGHSHQGSNVLGFAPFRSLPESPFAREGLSFSASAQHATLYCCIGAFGLNAGPDKHVIDENALSDPLLARLPVSPRVYFDFWTSHYFRDLPEGYVESVERKQNLLADPFLHEYYERLRRVTRGSLLSASRLRDIWAVNVSYRSLHRDYQKRRPIALSIPANHFRFQSDVGLRDDGAMTLRSTGRAGYLQYGPSIPLDAGFYRARWTATIEAAPGGTLGFVEVWADGERLSHQPIAFTGSVPAEHVRIAQADFSLPSSARRVEYRLYVEAPVRMALERVELFSGLAIPADQPPQ